MRPEWMILCLWLAPALVVAQEEDAPLSPEELAKAKTGTLQLDTLEVTSSLSVQQEAALRIVRQAMNEPTSRRRADFDKWRCWLEAPVGTRLNYLHCARNGDLWALRPRGNAGVITGQDLNPVRYGSYGEVLVSEKPINRAKLERMLGNLSGDGGNDHVFIDMVLKGDKPPRDVPSDLELDQFSSAWSEVEALNARGRDERTQINAIEEAGLSLDRYNRIAELVEQHQYIHDQVAERVASAGG